MKKRKYNFLIFTIIIFAIILPFFAKNSMIFPFGYNYATIYGFPIPIWEIYSLENTERARLFTYGYGSFRVIIPLPWNIIINILIPTILGILLYRDNSHADKFQKINQVLCLLIAFIYIILLGVNIFSSWRISCITYLYLVIAIVSEGVLLLFKITLEVTKKLISK